MQKLQLLHSLLAFLASLSVSLTELLSSCKSHRHYTFGWASFVLQKLQLLHSLLAFLASLSVPLTELSSSCKSHKHYTFFWPPRLPHNPNSTFFVCVLVGLIIFSGRVTSPIVNTLQPGYRSDIPLRAWNCSSPHARVTSLIPHCSSLHHHMSSRQELNFWDVLSAQKFIKDYLLSTLIPSSERAFISSNLK